MDPVRAKEQSEPPYSLASCVKDVACIEEGRRWGPLGLLPAVMNDVPWGAFFFFDGAVQVVATRRWAHPRTRHTEHAPTCKDLYVHYIVRRVPASPNY